jgi:hypothetical protein
MFFIKTLFICPKTNYVFRQKTKSFAFKKPGPVKAWQILLGKTRGFNTVL